MGAGFKKAPLCKGAFDAPLNYTLHDIRIEFIGVYPFVCSINCNLEVKLKNARVGFTLIYSHIIILRQFHYTKKISL